jgi:hypothetical protein
MAATLTKIISAVVTLTPCGPRKNIANQWFSAQLALGWDEASVSTPTAPTQPPQELLPWNDKTKEFIVFVREDSSVAAQTLSFIATPPYDGTKRRTPSLKAGAEALCKNWLTANKYQLAYLRNRNGEINDDTTDFVHDLPNTMGFLSTFAGEVSEKLNLTHYFQLAGLSTLNLTNGKAYRMLVVPQSVNWQVDTTEFKTRWDANNDAWKDGVLYNGTAKVKAYPNVLEFSIDTTNSNKFNFANESRETSLGLNFNDFWIRSQVSFAWGSELGEICDKTTDLNNLISSFLPEPESNGEIEPSEEKKDEISPEEKDLRDAMKRVRDDLHFRALARYSQWQDPAAPPAGSTTKQLLEKLLPALSSDRMRAEAVARLSSLFTSLTTPATAKASWGAILKSSFGSEKKAIELSMDPSASQLFFMRILLAQWDYAIKAIAVNEPLNSAEDPALVWNQLVPHSWKPEFTGAGYPFIAAFEKASRYVLTEKLPEPPAPGLILHGPEHCEQHLLNRIDAIKLDESKEFKEIEKLLSSWLEKEGTWLFSGTGLPAITVEELPDKLGKMSGRWTEFVKCIFIGKHWTPLKPGLEKKPSGLAIQIDNFQSDIADASLTPLEHIYNDSDEHSWRRIAGVGILVKDLDETDEQGNKKQTWRICSAASVGIPNSNGTVDYIFDAPAVIPIRIPYAGAHRIPIVEYNQRSPIADSALNDALSDDYEAQTDKGLLTPSAVKFDPVTVGDKLRLTRLRFGRKYKMAAFMIDASGGVPEEMSNTVPWRFDADFDDAKIDGKTNDQNIGVEFSYMRRVAVSAPRLSAQNSEVWPPIPNNVYPLAREILSTDETEPKPPMVLLSNSQREFKLALQPPSVDLDVLERWLPSTSNTDKKHLQQVFIDHFNRVASKNELREAKLTDENDLAIDDPAVASYLILLDQYNFAKGTWQTIYGWVQQKISGTGAGLQMHQSEPVSLNFKLNPGISEVRRTSAPKPNEFDIEVPGAESSVIRLRAFTLLAKNLIQGTADSDKTAKIASTAMDDLMPGWPTQSLDSIWYTGPHEGIKGALKNDIDKSIFLTCSEILIEGANAALPNSIDAWKALDAATTGENLVDITINAELETVADANQKQIWRKADWRNVGRCELLKQAWRWQGTPAVPPLTDKLEWPARDKEIDTTSWWQEARSFPEMKAGEPASSFIDLLLWERPNFQKMHDKYDSLVISLPFRPWARDPAKPEAKQAARYLDGFKDRETSEYVRYSVRLVSRYAGLNSGGYGSVEAKEYAIVSTAGGAAEKLEQDGLGWKRAFIPYRGKTPPKPVIKAIIPLTGSEQLIEVPANHGLDTAPFMVILDETAFRHCGITEAVEVSVDKSTRDGLYQIGTDPIVTADALKVAGVQNVSLTGPYGHTFDTDSRQSLYSASSYILPAIPITTDDARSMNAPRWTFAKVMARRLCGRAVTDVLPANLEDVYTKPTWIQFLPDRDSEFGQVSITEGDGNLNVEVECKTIKDDDSKFDYWLLVTSEIFDFKGHKNHERYRSVHKLTLDNNKLICKGINFEKENAVFRVIERQSESIKGLNSGLANDDLWDSVLANPDKDSPARITRISSKRKSTK